MPKIDWLPIDEAGELLVTKRLDAFGDDYIATHRFAWKSIVGKLADGSLRSRTLKPETFQLIFSSQSGREEFGLEPEQVIPALFWYYFDEAQDSGGPLVTLRSSTTDSSDGDFDFTLGGLRDNGTLTGKVSSVLVDRSQLPGRLPDRQGRPSKPRYNDEPAIREVIELIISGMPRSKAINQVAPSMEGNSMKAKNGRLSTKLSEAGYPGNRSG